MSYTSPLCPSHAIDSRRDRYRTESEQMHGQYNSLREQYDQLLADVRAFATPAATPPPLGTGRGPRTFDAIPSLDDDSSMHDHFPVRPNNATLGPRTSTFRVGEVVCNGPTTPHAVTSSPRGDYEDIQPREPGQNGLRVDGRGLGAGDPAGLEHLISALHTLTVNNRAERLASVVQRYALGLSMPEHVCTVSSGCCWSLLLLSCHPLTNATVACWAVCLQLRHGRCLC